MASQSIGSKYEVIDILESDAALVQEQEEKIIMATGIDMKIILKTLSIGSKLTQVAYDEVEVGAALQTEVRRIGINVADLGDKSFRTITKFNRTIADVLNHLRTTYKYLYEGLEEMASATLVVMSKRTAGMAEESLELAEAYLKESEHAEKVLADMKLKVESEQKDKKTSKAKETKLRYKVEEIRIELDTANDANPEEDEFDSRSGIVNYITTAIKAMLVDTEVQDESRMQAIAAKKNEGKQKSKRTYNELFKQLEEAIHELDCIDKLIGSLTQMIASLKRSSIVIRSLSHFWKMLHSELEQVSTDDVQFIIKEAMKLPAEKRAKVWRSESFTTSGKYYYAKWTALHNVCTKFLDELDVVQMKLDGSLMDSNTSVEIFGCLEETQEQTTANALGIRKPCIDMVFRHSIAPYNLKKTIVDEPDTASYWKLDSFPKYTGKGFSLLMFDTGIKRSHPSFASKKLVDLSSVIYDQDQYDDQDGHGTFASGIACGDPMEDKFGGKTVKCRGVAPGARLVTWTAFEKAKDDIDVDSWVEELEQLAENCDGVDVVVISSGTKLPKLRMETAIKKLDDQEVIVVCSAGNSGEVNKNNVTYPARYPTTVSVGAHNRLGGRCSYSAVGKDDEVDCLALGEDVIGPNLRNSLTQSSGTSFAAPAVGGLICLILEAIDEICTKENEPDVYQQVKTNRVMKHLLKELSTRGENNCISPKSVGNFFVNPGPKHFIERLKMDGII